MYLAGPVIDVRVCNESEADFSRRPSEVRTVPIADIGIRRLSVDMRLVERRGQQGRSPNETGGLEPS